MKLEPGQRWSWTRTITEDDIRRFSEISGDEGVHHVEKDAQGRLLAQGLLTATLPTKLGGDLDYIAKTMTFEFPRAVYSGDTLVCEAVVDSIIKQSSRLKAKFSFSVKNQNGEVVLTGTTAGQILKKA